LAENQRKLEQAKMAADRRDEPLGRAEKMHSLSVSRLRDTSGAQLAEDVVLLGRARSAQLAEDVVVLGRARSRDVQ